MSLDEMLAAPAPSGDRLPGAPGVSGGGPVMTGRDADVSAVARTVDRTAWHGGALVVTGEPGVGKSTVLVAVGEQLAGGGIRTLRCSGVRHESSFDFAGLNQLVLPIWEAGTGLEPSHREALAVALGLTAGPGPDRLLLSTALLSLLRERSRDSPLLMIVDDVQWLDRRSAEVLTVVARRLTGLRVGYLGAIRTCELEPFLDVVPELYHLAPLDDAAARTVLRRHFWRLAEPVRDRILAMAGGNPRALADLPSMLVPAQREGLDPLPPVLPLTARLSEPYATWLARLPETTRRLLLLLALDDASDLWSLRPVIEPEELLRRLAPAERERLVTVDGDGRRFAFHHPLAAAAVVALSTAAERRNAHRTWARALVGRPDGQAWHLSDAANEPDQRVAHLLDQVADRALSEGNAPAAVRALTRAAALTEDRSERGHRLARAAFVGARGGQLTVADGLLAAARRTDPGAGDSLRAASAAAFLLMSGDGDVETAHQLLVAAIEDYPGVGEAYDEQALLEAVRTLIGCCQLGARADLWQAAQPALDRLGEPKVLPEGLSIRLLADPARATPDEVARLDTVIARLSTERDAVGVNRVALLGFFVDRLPRSRAAVEQVRKRFAAEDGIVETNALSLLAWDYFRTGRWDESKRLAERGHALATGEMPSLNVWAFTGLLAQLAAVVGDDDRVVALCDELSNWALPRGAMIGVHIGEHARGMAALAGGDFEEAYRRLTTVSPAGQLAPYVGQAVFTALDLVEAAIHTGRHHEAAAHVRALRDARVAALSPRLALTVDACAALVAGQGDEADLLFQTSLGHAGADRWPFEIARVRLMYGEHLRRAGTMSRARPPLAAALDAFRRLGARPWAVRAAGELRATGLRRTSSRDRQIVQLSPQEHEIAMLAASGLTNKQVGERLFLSPRTVGNHLHRIFPKLGIHARAGLRDALSELPRDDNR